MAADFSWASDFGSNVAGDLVGGALAFVFGYLAHWGLQTQRHRQFDSFWGTECRTGKAVIVMGVYQDPRPANTNRYVKTYSTGQQILLPGGQEVGSVAEGRAASYVSSALAKHRSDQPVVSSDEDVIKQWDGTFLCLGSGASNEKSQVVLSLASNDFCDFQPAGIRSKWDGKTYGIQRNPPRDKALIVKLANPWTEGHSLIVCAGQAEPGTAGAAYYLARNWKKLQKRYGNTPFGVVLEVDWSSDQTAREIASSPRRK